MYPFTDQVLVFVMLINFLALGSSRMNVSIRAVALQGVALGFLPGIVHEFSWHIIAIVGWDDTTTPPSWIIKNSWGTDWGYQGYGNVARNQQDDCSNLFTDGTCFATHITTFMLTAAQVFGDITSVPTLFLFDRSGKTARVVYGAPPDLHQQAEQILDDLMKDGAPQMREIK